MAAQAPWSIETGGVRVFVRLTPKSSRHALEGVEALSDGRMVFRARVRAVPEDGKANDALCKVVAKALGVSISSTRLTGGATGRLKTLFIEGNGQDLARALEALATASRDG